MRVRLWLQGWFCSSSYPRQSYGVYCEHQRFEVGKFHDAKKTLQQSRVIDPEINAAWGKLLQEVFFRLDDAGRQFFTLKYSGMYMRTEGKIFILPVGGKGHSKPLPDVPTRLSEEPPWPLCEASITKNAERQYYALSSRRLGFAFPGG